MTIDLQDGICLEGELIRVVEGSSRLEQKVSRLFELLRDPIYRYLILVLGNRTDAEDLTQEVFLRLFTFLAKGQSVKNVRAWVFRVAQNAAVDLQRKKQRVEVVEPETWAEMCRQLRDPSPNVEHQMIMQEKRKSFLLRLQQLTPPEQRCLYLRVEGLSYCEIADVLGVAATTVPTFLTRGIKKLRKTHD